MILITGATGVLGSNLLFALAEEHKQLIALYRKKDKIARVEELFRKLDPIQGGEKFQKITWLEADVLDVVRLQEVLVGVQIVYHCAALVSYRRRDFPKMMKVNGQGTANMVNLSIEAGVKRFVHISSTAAIGKVKAQNGGYEVSETNKWTQDKSTSGYAISKYTSEKEVWRAIEEGLSAVILNPSVIIGPANWNESSMTIFRTVSKGLKFYTEGANAFVDVRDVVTAAIQLEKSEILGQRYLCAGNNTTFRALLDLIAGQIKKPAPKFKAGKIAGGIAWRLQSLFALFTGQQTLTKESVSSSMSKVNYDSSKLEGAIGIKFRPLEESIAYAIKNRLES